MNKAQLIAILEQMPDDSLILIQGYEGGYEVLESNMIREDTAIKTANQPGYIGNWDLCNPSDPYAHNVIVLERKYNE